MPSIKDLYTKEQSEQAEKLYIGDEWIEILGFDAESVRKAKTEADRGVISGKMTPDEALAHMMAAIIIGWSFPEECTAEEIKELCKNSPSLIEAIDRKSGEKANFTKRLKAASSNTQKQTSGSAKKGKARKG